MSESEPTRVASLGLTIPPGTRLNGIFEIESQTGSGGMGMVYRAHNVETQDAVAIKIVRAEMADNPQVLALFRREAAVLHRLLHDAIVRYYLFSFDKDIGLPYLATEFVDGTPLSAMIDEGATSRNEVLQLAERLADGLQAAHDLSIFHRDISPDNIILPERDVKRAKIIDFGIAKAAKVGEGTVIGDSIAGKFDYMSPEQLGLYGAAVDGRSDIYSLGIVLSEAIRGRGLDMGGTQLDVVEKRRKVPDLSDVADPGVRALLSSMMQPKPDDRVQSMSEVAKRAQALRTGVGIKPPGGALKKVAAGFIVLAIAGGAAAWYLSNDPRTTWEPDREAPLLVRQEETADPSKAPPPVLVAADETPTLTPQEGERDGEAGAGAGQDGTEEVVAALSPSDGDIPPSVSSGDEGAGDGAPGDVARSDPPDLPAAQIPTASTQDPPRVDGEEDDQALAEQGPDNDPSAPFGSTEGSSPSVEDQDPPQGDDVEIAALPEVELPETDPPGSSPADPTPPAESDAGETDSPEAAAEDPAADASVTPEIPRLPPLSGPPAEVAPPEEGDEAPSEPETQADEGAEGSEVAALPPSDDGTQETPADPPVDDNDLAAPPEEDPPGEDGRSDEVFSPVPPRDDPPAQTGEATPDAPADGNDREERLGESEGEVDVAALQSQDPSDPPANATDTQTDPSDPPDSAPGVIIDPQDLDDDGDTEATDDRTPAPDPRENDESGDVDVAALPPTTVPLDDIDPLSPFAPAGEPEHAVIRYVRQSNLGPCTYLRPTSIGPESASIDAYGDTVPPFAEFDENFSKSMGFEASITLRLVTEAQCPAVDLADALASHSEGKLRFKIDKDTIFAGDVLSGAITGLDGRDLRVFLVASDGRLYDLDDLITRGKDDAALHTVMSGSSGDDPAHVIVAIAGEALPDVSAAGPLEAAEELRDLGRLLSERPDSEVVLGYFKYEG